MICTHCGGLTRLVSVKMIMGDKYYVYQCNACGKYCRKKVLQ